MDIKTFTTTDESEKALKAIVRARSKLILNSPFFATIALMLKLVEAPEIPTMATNSVYLKYNSQFVNNLSETALISVICHEVLHVSLLHVFRRNNRDSLKWNVACDYVVNLIIESMPNLKLPNDCLHNSAYKGMTAEEVYAILPEDEVNQNTVMPGNSDDYEQDKSDSSSLPTAQQQQQWKQIIAQAANAARISGGLSRQLERLITDTLTPTLPWQELLSRFVTETSTNDYSWQYPNKRYLYSGLYLPKLSVPTLGNIAVIIDTSGSIDQQQLNEFAAELRAILSVYPETQIEVIYVDYMVNGHESVDICNLELHSKGGGGTDFRPGFKHIIDNNLDVSCIIYFTDGYCNSFPNDPEIPTLWIINSPHTFTPPFGEVINQ
jgi:predicted metal-dependent peptidase